MLQCPATEQPCTLDDLSKFNDIAKRCVERWKTKSSARMIMSNAMCLLLVICVVMYNYVLLPFDVGIVYLLNLDKCKHLVKCETRSNLIIFCYRTLLSRLMHISTINILLVLTA